MSLAVSRLALPLLAMLASACAPDTVTRYQGIAMIDAAPDSSGALALTFFSRDDTAFTGAMQLGPPVNGGGVAYAWFEGGELNIYTTHDQRGDSILWNSKASGERIGGRFAITGGPRVGQGGTWRATLSSGRPASTQTLAAPRGSRFLPLSALLPLVLLVLGIAWIVRWVRRVPPLADDSVTDSPGGKYPIGGWLTLFVLGQSLGLVIGAAQFRSVGDEYHGAMTVGAIAPAMPALVLFEIAVQVALFAGSVAGLTLIFKRHPAAPRFWFAILLFLVGYSALDLAIASDVNGSLFSALGTEVPAMKEYNQLARQLVAGAIWALYWRRSKRVRRTFGYAALDKVRHRPDAPATELVLPGVRATKIAIGSIAGLIVAALVVAWLMGFRSYSVGEDEDIRTVVAGRWSWKTESPLCGHRAHTIAFSEEGQAMTITTPGTASDSADHESIYDILYSDRSRIRGEIRGETRLTADSVPVVWDLIMVNRDEYRWRRTDLGQMPWAFTSGIVRCPPADSTKG
jgi:hypothetical protein